MTDQPDPAAHGETAYQGRFSAAGINCVRGERLVFQDIGFTLGAGGALILRGPNGSGKSSLLRLATGLLRPEAGVISWDGEDIAKDFATHRTRLHYVGHQDPVKSALTVEENVAFWAAMGGRPEATHEALALLEIDNLADVPARFLSAGQRRRVNLARIVAAHAPLWLLDEPTVGLDDSAVAALGRIIAEHRSRRGMVMVATHLDLGLEDADVLTLSQPPVPSEE